MQYESQHLPRRSGRPSSVITCLLAVVCLLLSTASTVRADEERWVPDDARWAFDASTGLVVGKMSGLDSSGALEFGLSRKIGSSFLLRGSLGVFGYADRHAIFPLPFLRLEGATDLQTSGSRVVPRVGAGVVLWGGYPNVYGLLGVGRRLSTHWTMAVDVRAGAVHYEQRVSPAGELQLRFARSF